MTNENENEFEKPQIPENLTEPKIEEAQIDPAVSTPVKETVSSPEQSAYTYETPANPANPETQENPATFGNTGIFPSRANYIADYDLQKTEPRFKSPNWTQQEATANNFGSDEQFSNNAETFSQFPPQKQTTLKQQSAIFGAIAGVVAAAAVIALFIGLNTLGFVKLNSSAADISQLGNDVSLSQQPLSDYSNSETPNWDAVNRKIAAAVVSIRVESKQSSSLGSGVIIDSKGFVITNNHVIDAAADSKSATIQVTLSSGSIYDTKIVGTDPTTDLAVLQIEKPPSNLVAAEFGDSETLHVGQDVMAVGNPLGYENTATTGIISALNRPVAATDSGQSSNAQPTVTNAIQVDAAINSGNSGGPLFDGNGKVIGITSSIATSGSTSGSIGIGFAIPSRVVSNVYSQLSKNGVAEHAYLGIYMQDSTTTADGVTRGGAEITKIQKDTPAQKAGLKEGDVIVAINSKPTTNTYSLTAFIHEFLPNDTVDLTIVRDGKSISQKIKLAKATAETAEPEAETQPETQNPWGDGNGSEDGMIDPFEFFFGR